MNYMDLKLNAMYYARIWLTAMDTANQKVFFVLKAIWSCLLVK